MSAPAAIAQRRRGDRAFNALIGGQVEHLADRRLAAGAQQHGPAKRPAGARKIVEDGEVLLGGLAEADARIDDRAPPRRRRRPSRDRERASRSAKTSATTFV